jgi:hypothetical protein
MPKPPILFVRPSISFWVEPAWDGHAFATAQAVREGVFQNAWCLDGTGGRWQVAEARLLERPGRLPWKRLRVGLQLGARSEAQLADVVEQLCRILRNPDFEYYRGPTADELEAALRAARSPAEVIEIAARIE